MSNKPIIIPSYVLTCESALEHAFQADAHGQGCEIVSKIYNADDILVYLSSKERVARSTRRYEKAVAQFPNPPGRNYRPGR